MPSSLANKKELSEAAQGPPWVRSIGSVETLGIGKGVRALYGRWFEHLQERRRQQQDAAAVAAFRAAPPRLAPVQQRVVDALTARGVAYADVRELVGPVWWERLQTAVTPWLESQRVRDAEHTYRTSTEKKWKDYLVRMFGRDAPIALDSPWIQFALQPAVIDTVNTYLGLLSKLLYVDVWDTVPLVHDGPDMGSQRWHRDPEDAKLVKTFLYFSDVDAGSGAMQYVPNSRRGEQYGRLWPQQFPKGSVPPPEEFDRLIPADARELCAKPSGTLMFVDTSGFHRGGRALDRRRVLATWTYTRQSSVWPRAFELTGAGNASLSEAGRFALLS
jgi:hypothetical protein